MEGHEFLTEYRNISNKLKKRFLRRPNVSEASDHFRQLAKRLEDAEEPQYAALCHLAVGRCEQTIGNSTGEVEAITQAARTFLRYVGNNRKYSRGSLNIAGTGDSKMRVISSTETQS